jgi:hypothetical protein
MNHEVQPIEHRLFSDIRKLIEESRLQVSQAVNAGLTLTYWNIGKRINEEILGNQRAGYGEMILPTLSSKLEQEYGKGFSEKNLRRMIQFYQVFPDYQIVATLSRQLSWSHFTLLIPIKDELQREFYAQMCRIENWSFRTLKQKMQSMLFERTAISKKPEELAKLELQQLSEENKMTPDLVFRDPYILDFLGLKDV